MLNIQAFCTKENTRYLLQHPILRGGWRYATNGKILIRIPAPSDPPDGTEKNDYPDVEGLCRSVDWAKCTEPLPPLRTDPEGTAREIKCECTVCGSCDGTGECTCPNCDNEHDCPDCDGLGKRKSKSICPDCNGTGVIVTKRWKVQSVGQKYVNCQLLSIIHANLSNVQYLEDGKINERIAFTADGGVQGILMPIQNEYTNEGAVEIDEDIA